MYIFSAIIFFFGASLGSFVALIVNRYNTGLSFFWGKSFCFSCNTKLKIKDLVPIFSFLGLKGKCRYCGIKIPKEVLFIEIVMGLLSLLAASKSNLLSFEQGSHYLILTLIFAVILLISLYDLKHFIIPDTFLLALLALSVLYLLVLDTQFSILNHIGASLILPLPFLCLFLISKGRLFGLGDIKYIAVFGFLLGMAGGLSAVILGFWTGALYALLALFVFKKNLTMKSEIPFGPFLSLGIILSLYFDIDLFHLNEFFQFI